MTYAMIACALGFGTDALGSRYGYLQPTRWFTLLLWAIFIVTGALIGIVAEALGWRPEIVSRLLLMAAYFYSIATKFALPNSPFGSSTPHGAALYTIAEVGQASLLLLLVFVSGRGTWRLGSWSFALLLVLPWFILVEFTYQPRITKALEAGGSFVIVAAFSLVLNFVLRRHVRALQLITACGAIVFIGVSLWALFATQRPIERPRPIREAAAGSPNVILITLDTVRDENTSLGGYSKDTTPNLVRFASDAWLFRKNYASSNNTLTTHASLLTGLDPTEHGANFTPDHKLGNPLSGNFPTLAGVLGHHGYATAAIVANSSYLSMTYGFDRGFDFYDQRIAEPILGPLPPYTIGQVVRNLLLQWFFRPGEADVLCRNGATITDEAIDRTRRLAESHHPFFLFVNYVDAHYPYMAEDAFRGRFGKTTPWVDDGLYEELAKSTHISPQQSATLINRYDESIATLDHEVGRLLDYLRTSGIADRSLIIVTSDHGEGFGKRGYLNHHKSLYDDQIEVPLIIRFPGGHSRRVVDDLSSSVDVFSTALAAAHVPIPPTADGIDLAHSQPNRVVLSEHYDNDGDVRRAMIDSTRKLIVWRTGRRELYDLQSDPGERHDLSTQLLATDLDNALGRKLQDLRAAAPGGAAPRPNEAVFRSLGYLQ